jgi:hypothetical protein
MLHKQTIMRKVWAGCLILALGELAVVAREVRALTRRSADVGREIKAMIANSPYDIGEMIRQLTRFAIGGDVAPELFRPARAA